jgi:hypothetical protein
VSTITLNNAIATEDNAGPTGSTLIVYQRNVAGNTDVALSGTYTLGTPTHVEYTLNGGSTWTGVSSEVISGGNWSGTMLSVAKNDYTLSVRWSNSTSVTATSLLALGDVGVLAGDSTATDQSGIFPAGPCTGPHKVWIWQLSHNDWFDATSVTYESWAAQLGTDWVTDYGCPLVLIPCANSGNTLMNNWNGTTWKNTGATTAIQQMLDRIVLTKVSGVSNVFMMIGANDIDETNAVADWTAALDDFATQCASVITGAPTCYVQIMSDSTGGLVTPPDDSWATGLAYRTELDHQRIGQFACVHMKIGANLTGQTYVNGGNHTHPDTTQYGVDIGDRFWAASKGHACPKMTSVQQDSGKTHIYINTDTTMSAGVDPAAFAVLDAGTPVTISTAAYVTTTQIKLTLASPTNGAVTVYFASGRDAVGLTVPLSAAFTSATGGTMTQPLQPFFAVTPGTYTPSSNAMASVFAGCLR